MAWSYRRRIKIIPGVQLNFSKSGISTSIGVRGAKLTFTKMGTYLNTGFPGTGIYNRQKLLNPNAVPTTPLDTPTFESLDENIFSADVQEITSQDMQGIKEAIISAHEQRIDLKKDLAKIEFSIFISKINLVFSYIFLYGLIKREIKDNIQSDLINKKDVAQKVKKQIENCYVGLDIDFEPEIEQKYLRLVESFKKLCTSDKIWDVVSAHAQDRVIARSSASTIVSKREVRFGIKTIDDIKSKYEPLWFKNANGADLYFFPSFIVMYSSSKNFAIIGLDELEFYYSYVRFTETGIVPRDSKIIDKTWAKVNKNGTADKRFKDNYQIPIVRYGEIALRTNTGLHEVYQLSNYEYSTEFGYSFIDYQSTIKK
jgi:Protein of unknown function (DUF4236)